MRSQCSDGRVLLRIRIGIGCGNDDAPEPGAVLATRWQHRCSQWIALPVAQREKKRHLSLYMGLEANVALDRVGPRRSPGLDCLLPLAAEIFLDRVAHQARLMRRFTFRLDTEPNITVRRVANILHFSSCYPAILGRWASKSNTRSAPVYNAARSYDRKFGCNTARLLPERRWNSDLMKFAKRSGTPNLVNLFTATSAFGAFSTELLRTTRSLRSVMPAIATESVRRNEDAKGPLSDSCGAANGVPS